LVKKSGYLFLYIL